MVIVVVTSGGGGKPGTNNGPSTLGSRFAHKPARARGTSTVDDAGNGLTENVLIADRNNNRLLAISPKGQIVARLKQETPERRLPRRAPGTRSTSPSTSSRS